MFSNWMSRDFELKKRGKYDYLQPTEAPYHIDCDNILNNVSEDWVMYLNKKHGLSVNPGSYDCLKDYVIQRELLENA